MKKYIKLMIFGLLAFLSSLTVNAKQMSIDELGEEALNAKPSTQYMYIIGNYAYTSEYVLTIKEIMLAAKSIDDPSVLPDGTLNLDAMNIQKIVPDLNNFELTGKWKVVDNLVGDKKLDPSKELNIYFIDGGYEGETSNAKIIDVPKNVQEYNDALDDLDFSSGNSNHSEGLKIENNQVSGLLLKTDISDNIFSGDDKTGYYFAFVLEVPEANDNTKITIKGYKNTTKATIADFDIKPNDEGKTPGLVILSAIDPNAPVEDRKIVVTVDQDGDNLEYAPTDYILDYSNLRYQQETNIKLTSESIPAVDLNSIATKYGYQKSKNDTYKLIEENGIYKLKGDIVNQTISKDVFPLDEETGYYFMINVGQNIDSKYYNKATVTYPGDGSTKTSTITDNTGITILFSTSEIKKNNKLTITVDLDGNENEYFKVNYEIDLSELLFKKNSEFTVKELTDSNKFKNQSGWYGKDYSIVVTKDNDNKALYHVSGLLPIVDDSNWSFNKDLNLYYLGLLLNLSDQEISNENNIEVKVQNDLIEKKFSLNDVTKEIYILKAIQESDSKEITIIVDLDGNGSNYVPYEITLDCSNLKFQQPTSAKINVPGSEKGSNIPDSDIKQLTSWGYKFPDDIKLSSNNKQLSYNSETGELKGAIKEQRLSGGFKEADLDSYFYTFTIKPEKITEDIKVTIQKGDTSKEFTYKDFVQDTLTVLQHIPLNEEGNKKITIIVDSDGDNKDYLENKYTIDYSNADFIKLHTVTIQDGLNGNVISTEYIYDQEKLTKPATPLTKITKYTKFAYWNELASKKEFKFENGITDDLTLYPIWNLYINTYLDDSIKAINDNNNEFVIEKNSNNLEVDFEERETLLSEVKDTKLSKYIAHALATGTIQSIKLEIGEKSVEFSTTKTNESEIEQDVLNDLKNFFTKTVVQDNGEKTLDDLYDVWQPLESKLIVTPKENVAKFNDKNMGDIMEYSISVIEELIISFNAGILNNPNNMYVKTGEDLTNLPSLEIPTDEKDYRTFDGWFVEQDRKESLTKVQEDTKLTAHYSLNVDKYLEKVIKDLKYDCTKENNKITFNLTEPNMPLSDLYNQISETIYNILQKGEIKDITFTSKKFTKETTKDQILKDIKETLGEDYTTLDQLEYLDKTFTITVGDTIDTVKLVNNNTYTFDFKADFVVVNQTGKGATDIEEALTKEYSTIYLDGNYNLSNTLYIEKNITIKSVLSFKNEKPDPTKTTITVSSKDYAIEVKNAVVTISDIKITGAKKGQLRIDEEEHQGGATENKTKVTVNNIDVSGITIPAKSRDEDIHAAIIVKGDLIVNGEIKNSDEHCTLPTIALITSYSYPLGNGSTDEGAKHNLSTTGKVTLDNINMTISDRYHIMNREENPFVQLAKETYYGSFYYINGNNSKFYYLGLVDNKKASSAVYDYIFAYYYGEKIDLLNKLKSKYQEGVTLSDDQNFVFQNFQIRSKGTILTNDQYSQDVLDTNTTTTADAIYIAKPSSTLNFDKPSSNIITKQTDGKFYLPVSLTSEKFRDGETTLKVTNPNNVTEEYTYSSNSKDGIATVSNAKTINLNLEAIKSSKITTGNGKVYTIKLDIDGEASEYQEEIYKVDYNDIKTLEEVINEAAVNTENTNSLTVVRDNRIKNNDEQFTYMYNKTTMRTLYNSTDGKIEQYSFQRKYANPNNKGEGSVFLLKNPNSKCDSNTLCKPKIKTWEFSNFIQRPSMGIHEISLLKDVITTNKKLNAIDSVTEVNGKYEILINMERFTNWLNDAYLTNDDKSSSTYKTNNEDIKLIVELTSDKKYIKSIKTSGNFTIVDTINNITTYDNRLNVIISDINKTDILEPETFLETTKEELKEFDTKSQEYWEKTTGSEVAK